MTNATTPVGEAFRPPQVEQDVPHARKRNRLPLDEYTGHKAYLLTLATAGKQPFFKDARLVAYCLNELRSAAAKEHFDVLAYCFMPAHLHLLVAGQAERAWVVDFVKRFKQKTGFWFRNKYQTGGLKASPTGLWQRSYHDHVLRSDEALGLAADYVIGNPIQAGLATRMGEYLYAGSFVWDSLNPGRKLRGKRA